MTDAARAAGLPATEDYNGAQQDGFARMQMTIEHGRRCSGAVAYLRPALSRPNLTVEIKALVTRLLFDGARVVGVEYIRHGEKTVVRAEREVILSGGSINSPQLLMLSGIGDPDELGAQRIPVRVPLSGVGKNLQDHVAALVTYARRQGGPFQHNMRLDRLALSIAQGFVFGTGFATNLPGGPTAFLKSDSSQPIPDIQLLFIAAPLFEARPYLPPFSQPFSDGFACRLVVLRPESRGQVRLASADPGAAPRIEQNLLATDRDWNSIRAGIRLFRELSHQPALQPFIKTEIGPGPAATSDEAIDAHIRATAVTAHHPAGTCRMGTDAMAVVDPELRVRGTRRSSRRRCVGFSRSGRRQHQCTRGHDRREGGGPDPRPYALGAGGGVNSAAGNCEHGLRNARKVTRVEARRHREGKKWKSVSPAARP